MVAEHFVDLFEPALGPEPPVLIEDGDVQDGFLHQVLLHADDPVQLLFGEAVGLSQLVHRPPDPRLVGDEGRADGIPADQADDVRGDVLIGHLRTGRIQLLRGKALSVQGETQGFKMLQESGQEGISSGGSSTGVLLSKNVR